MGSEPWRDEEDAARIVCTYMKGVAQRVDPGGGAVQSHDFDIALSDGRTVAVEVTRHNVQEALRTLAETSKRSWRFQELRNIWVVKTSLTFAVAPLHKEVADLLAELETAGIDSLHVREALFDETLHDDELDDDERQDRELLERTSTWRVAERLRSLGVRHVYQLSEADAGKGEVLVSDAPQVGSTGSSVVVNLLEYHVHQQDNLRKLQAAYHRSERHLFVWVESSQHAAVAAIETTTGRPYGAGLPDRSPSLPDVIDAVWAATAYQLARVWRYHRTEGWRDLGRFPVRPADDS